MSKRYTIILILAAVLLTGFSAALSRRDSRDWRANRSRRVFPFPWQDVASIDIAKPDGSRLHFRKPASGEWLIQLDDEHADALNPGAVEELSALATLSWREAQKDRQAPDADSAVIMTAANASGQTVELMFGDVRNNLRATVIDGDRATVYGVNQDLLGILDWNPERFRNLYLTSVGGGRKPRKIILAPHSPDESLTVILEQGEAGAWRLVKPVSWPVDEARLDTIIRWLDRLRAETIEAEMTGDLEWFGFGPESTVVEAWYDSPSGEMRRRVEFGKDAGDGRIYVRETGRAPIFALPREALSEILLDTAAEHPERWRNFYRKRNLKAIGEDPLQHVVVERLLPKPVKLTLTQRLEKGLVKWEGRLEDENGERVFPVDPPDEQDPMRPLSALLLGLTNLHVDSFLADEAPGDHTRQWTAFPAWRFGARTIGGVESPTLTLYAEDAQGTLSAGVPYVEGKIGAQKMPPREGTDGQAGIPFSLADRSAVMSTYAELAYALCLPPYRYQSARIVTSEPRQWRRVVIANADGETAYFRNPEEVNEQWWREEKEPEPLMDDNNSFVETLLLLSQLKSEAFVADIKGDIAEFGLDRPEITAIVYSSPGGAGGADDGEPLFKLSIGDAIDAAGRRYASLNDAGSVFAVSPRIAELLGQTYR